MRTRTLRESTTAARTRDNWRWYDNDGSYNGEFDWVPRHLRVGPWSTPVILALSGAPLFLLCSRPASDSLVIRPSLKMFSSGHLIDVSLFIWCIAIIIVCKRHDKTLSGLSLSYSGWTWLLLTARCAAGTEHALFLARI